MRMKGRVRQDATIHATSIYRFVTTSVKYIYLLCEIYLLPTLCESYQLDICNHILLFCVAFQLRLVNLAGQFR